MYKVLIGITGSVAAVKALALAKAIKQFAEVRLVLTKPSEYFLKADINHFIDEDIRLYHDQDEWPTLEGAYQVGDPILHIELRRWADLFVIAPLDANTLAKLTYGLCDNLLTSVVRAWDWQKPLILCPAMNTYMWHNAPTNEQVEALMQRGAAFIAPVEKKLACQDIGMGGMANIDEITSVVRKKLKCDS